MAGNIAWSTRPLEELIEAGSTVTYGVVKPGDADPAGVLFIRGGDIADGRVLRSQLRTITSEVSAQYRRTLLRGGELIVSLVGNPGQVALVPPELAGANIARQVGLVRLGSEVDPLFVRYFLFSGEGQAALGAKSLGSVQQVINLGDLKRVHVPVPPLPEQRAIAGVLGALDDKIEVNRKTARVLEGIARAVFTSWFVDFDPVRRHPNAPHAAASHPGSAAARRAPGPAPLPADLAALFPSRLVDSPIGEVPEIPDGWTASRLTDHFNLTMGQSPPGSTYNETGEGLPFYQGRTDYGFRFPTPRVYCTAPTRFAEAGDTLVSVRAPVGDVNMAIERCAVGRGVAAVRHKSGSRSLTYYAMHALRAHFLRFEADGTVFGAIGKTDFERLPFVAPPPPIVVAFEKFAAPIDQRIEGCERQSATLAALRDALLPKLISGELRIANAEKIVGRVI